MGRHKPTDEAVAKYYLALTDEERSLLDGRIEASGRRLSDMRISKSTGKLDERLLIPRSHFRMIGAGRLRGRLRNADGTMVPEGEKPDNLSRKGIPKTAGLAARRFNRKLEKGQTLQSYINEQLSDGIELAHFYIDIIRMKPVDAKRAGIYMNHKIAAAAWLGERGWGKPKGDDEKSGSFTINVVNHANAETLPPPVRVPPAEVEASIATAESDAGRDVPRLEDFSQTDFVKIDDLVKKEEQKVEVDFELEDVR